MKAPIHFVWLPRFPGALGDETSMHTIEPDNLDDVEELREAMRAAGCERLQIMALHLDGNEWPTGRWVEA